MIIGVDFDEVLINFVDGFVKWHNKIYGTNLKRSDFLSYELDKTLRVTKEEGQRRVWEFYRSSSFKKLRPVEGSVETTRRLERQGNSLFILTSRPEEIVRETEECIDKFFNSIFVLAYFTNEWHSGNNHKSSKADICGSIKADYLIEDSLDYAIRCSTCVPNVLLFDCPWNQRENLPSNVIRVKSWQEILENIKSKP